MNIDIAKIIEQLHHHQLSKLVPMVEKLWQSITFNHGDIEKWQNALDNLPKVSLPYEVRCSNNAVEVTSEQALSSLQYDTLMASLIDLKPWRKGPFQLFDIFIDTEWRSNIKWQRIDKAIEKGEITLKDKTILDVGCGNGYYGFKMLDHDPEYVLGIDPSLHYCHQFALINHYFQSDKMSLLPLTLEHFYDDAVISQKLRQQFQGFDVVLSMGVLYHRKSPIDHLLQLKQITQKGGQVILETLIIDSNDEHQVLLPENRYAGMTNVWFIPSIAALKKWMLRCGFVDVRVLDVSETTTEEQRKTSWVDSYSLDHFLENSGDNDNTSLDNSKPIRVILTAKRP